MPGLTDPEFIPTHERLPVDPSIEPHLAEVIDMQGWIQPDPPTHTLEPIVDSDVDSRDETNKRLSYLSDLRKVRFARDDPERFDALIGEYEGFLRYKVLSYFLPGGGTDDLMQEARFGFHKAVRDYDGTSSSFRNFADLCVARQVITAVKAATRNKHTPLNNYTSFADTCDPSDGEGGVTLGETLSDKSPSPDDVVASRESIKGLLNVLTLELTYIENACLKMLIDGESYETTAEELGIGTKSVDNALQRVRQKVSLHLDSDE